MTFPSRYRTISSGVLRLSLCIALALVTHPEALGQSKAELQRQRDALNEKIAYTRKLIKDARENQSTTTRELQALERQITLRNRLISNLSAEVRELESETDRRKAQIDALNDEVERMREEYAQMVYQAYKNRNAYDKLMYIFASDDFDQAFRRLKLMQRYGEVRSQHKLDIEQKQMELSQALAGLDSLRGERVHLLDAKQTEKEQLSEDKGSRSEALAELKSRESDLRKQQQQQESERQRINRAIQRIIEEELRAERNRSGGSFSLTPEGEIISRNFEKNKGKLPWPVGRGVVIQRFGQQPHASLPGIVIDNKGVDIATDPGAKVQAIFEGTVTSIFSIPGAGQNVILTHGAYKTVYTNLQRVSVRKGDTVSTYQEIGELLEQDGNSVAHLEIWQVSNSGGTPQNPEYWISK